MVGMSWVFVLMMLAGQGGNDLLDYMPTNTWWQTQGVEMSVKAMSAELQSPQAAGDIGALVKQLGDADWQKRDEAQKELVAIGRPARDAVEAATKSNDPEVATRAKTILVRLDEREQQAELRQLMAVKALGELKDPAGVAVLKPLLKSQKPFVADYAAEAIARIQGKPYTRPGATKKELDADLAMLPPNCGVVAQLRVRGPAKPTDFNKALDEALKAMPGPMANDEGDPKAQALQQLCEMLTQAAQTVGNVRAQAVTVGVADDVGNNSGFIALIGRGVYSPGKVTPLIEQEMRGRAPQEVEGVKIYQPDQEVMMACPSTRRFLLVAGPRQVALPMPAVVKLMKSGAAEPMKGNATMQKLLARVDRTKPLWAVMQVTDAYKLAPMLPAFKTLILEGDEKDGVLNLKLVAEGDDVEAIKAAVEQFNSLRADALQEMQNVAQMMPAVKPYVDLLQSVKVQNAGKTVTVTGQLKGGTSIMYMMPMMMFGVRAQAVQVQVASPAPMPAQAR